MKPSKNTSTKTLNVLAKERTILATERNALAFIRTGFSSFLLGLALINLFGQSSIYIYGGWIAIFFGLFFILSGIVLYFIRKNRMKTF